MNNMKKNKNHSIGKPFHSSDKKEKKEDPVKSALRYSGYLLPTNDEELEEFEKMFGSTQVMFPVHLNSSDFLFEKEMSSKGALKSIKAKEHVNSKDNETISRAQVKPLATNPYFKDLVFAAEIASQLYYEPTFGHVKFFKIYYICDQVCNLRLNINPRQCAAGPFDPEVMGAIDTEFINKNWFSVTKGEYGFRYQPLKNCNDYKQYYLNYFSDVKDQVGHLISIFRRKNTDFCEKVATLFAVWKEELLRKNIITNDLLIEKFYQWSKEKRRFNREELILAIDWMEDNSIKPCPKLLL
jgi:hypothetical protein